MSEEELSSSNNKQPIPTFQLDLHAWIESQQMAHGVRHDDYGQYQAYCTRRLSRISHHPDAKQYLVCSSKFATSTTSSWDNTSADTTIRTIRSFKRHDLNTGKKTWFNSCSSTQVDLIALVRRLVKIISMS